METKIIAGAVIGALVIGGGSFYAGMHYAQAARGGRSGTLQFATRDGQSGNRFMGVGGGTVFGTILSKDEQGITVQLMSPVGPGDAGDTAQGTGSKIVLVNTSTQINKSASGTSDDLTTGETVVVQGTQNSDGSITAQTIQIRPAGTSDRAQRITQ